MEEILDIGLLVDNEEDDDIDDALILHVLHDVENLGIRAELYGQFDLQNLLEIECKTLFRFGKDDIPILAQALGIPDIIRTNNRDTVSGTHGLCILLRRLAYPNRLVDLEPLFGLSAAAISNICNCMLDIVHQNKGHLLENLGNLTFLNHQKLIEYSQATVQKGCPLMNCWGFIDGTARLICRQSLNQENYYSGHKKAHCVKYQSVICPDGIVVSLKGAYEGRRHDAGIFRESGLYEELTENVVFPDQNFVIYGDQAYGLRELLIRPYTEHEIAGQQERQNFNNSMSALRISVEWGFNKVIQLFSFLDLKKNQRILLQDIEQMYKVAMILTNCHTCMYGSETAHYFNIIPPTLDQYYIYYR